MNGMIGLVNQMKGEMRQRESECQSVWKEVQHFIFPVIHLKLCDQRLLGTETAQWARWKPRKEALPSHVSTKSGQDNRRHGVLPLCLYNTTT